MTQQHALQFGRQSGARKPNRTMGFLLYSTGVSARASIPSAFGARIASSA